MGGDYSVIQNNETTTRSCTIMHNTDNLPTVTINMHVSSSVPLLLAVHVTVVVSPILNVDPDAGLQDTVIDVSLGFEIVGSDHDTVDDI